jgi:hypothetical protein
MPLITQEFPFERAAEAYRLLEEHPEEAVQVLLRFPNLAEVKSQNAKVKTEVRAAVPISAVLPFAF